VREFIPRKDWLKIGPSVIVTCPQCRKKAALDHTIEEDGDVNPSLICPFCGYHNWVKLEDWKGSKEKVKSFHKGKTKES